MSTLATPHAVVPWRHRVIAAARLHTANPWTTLITPWLIVVAVFGATYAIWWAVIANAGGRSRLDADAFVNNGGGSWIYFFMLVIAIQTMSLTFPFALGMGVTRRDYYLGTGGYFVTLSLLYGCGISVLSLIERATDGWGVDGVFFAPGPLADLPVWQLAPFHTAVLLLFFFTGAVAGSVWVRWRVVGIYVLIGALIVTIVAAVWGITVIDGWTEVGDYLSGHTVFTHAMLTLPLTAAIAVVGHLILRRAAPRT